jgi:hypothetical protein
MLPTQIRKTGQQQSHEVTLMPGARPFVDLLQLVPRSVLGDAHGRSRRFSGCGWCC